MRRNIGEVAQNLLKNEIRLSQSHSDNSVEASSAHNKQKTEKKDRYEGKKQFNLVLPKDLYEEIRQAAADEERSMNSFIVFALKQALRNQ